MKVKRLNIALGLALFLSLCLPCTAETTGQKNSRACRDNLEVVGHALAKYAEDNEGQMPAGLHHLKPDYLKEVLPCPVDASLGEFLPIYSRTADHEIFGLRCENEHDESSSSRLMTGLCGDKYFQHAPMEQWDAEGCRDALFRRGDNVARYLEREKHIPDDYRLQGTIGDWDPCADYYRLVRLNEIDFQLVCTSGNHTWEGLRPLSLYYDSKTREVTPIKLIPLAVVSSSPLSLRDIFIPIFFSLALIVFVLWRFYGPKAKPRVKDSALFEKL